MTAEILLADHHAFAENPLEFRNRLLDWLPKGPPADEVAATRHQMVDIAAYVKRYDTVALLEALRCARLTEWEMAHRWPATDGTNHYDGRPPLHACKGDCPAPCSANDRAWNSVYTVGRASRDRLLIEEDLYELSQAAVIRWVNGAHVANNSGENEWYTPRGIIEAARALMGAIDVDPASSDTAQATVRATAYFTAETDGLAHDWPGRVWINPPYSQPLVGFFTDRLLAQLGAGITTEAVTLTNNATETGWGAALIDRAAAVCFPTGRIRFIDPEGNPGGAPLQGQMITYHGLRADEFAARFKAWGPVLHHG